MRRLLLSFILLLYTAVASAAPSLQVIDEDGRPIKRFEVMLHTADIAFAPWIFGAKGKFEFGPFELSYGKSAVLDVFVRAEGYASTAQSFQGQAKQQLLNGDAKITLEHGQEFRLRLRLPDGMQLPKELLPQLYFPEFAWCVEMMWQPQGQAVKPDHNMLNVRAAKDESREFVFRLPQIPREFFIALHQPGWLQMYKAGPFSRNNFPDGSMDLSVPAPGTIDLKVDWGNAEIGQLPCSGLQYSLFWLPTKSSPIFLPVANGPLPINKPEIAFTDLAPGTYRLQVTTQPKDGKQAERWDEINPGRFTDIKIIDVAPGQTVSQIIHYVPFIPDAIHGTRTARIHILGSDGMPAAGKKLKVSCYDGHYGSLPVFEGRIPPDGIVSLEGITDFESEAVAVPFGPYHVEIGGQAIGSFRVTAVETIQDFTFTLAPQVGDTAPDVELVNTNSNEHIHLKDYRGKIVFLEFWETGCGPCQPTMANLNELVGTYRDGWKNDVEVLSVSFDDNPEIINSHVQSRGWTNLRHYWSARKSADNPMEVALKYVVNAVPNAVLIDREGKIAWRGHPASFDLANEVKKIDSWFSLRTQFLAAITVILGLVVWFRRREWITRTLSGATALLP